MIERLLIGLGVLVLIALLGFLVQRWQRHRVLAIASTRSIGSSANGRPQILSFYGPGCGACVTQKQELEHLQQSERDGVSIRLVDAVADCDLALDFGVVVVPTTLVARADGQIVAATSGVVRRDQLVAQLASAAVSTPWDPAVPDNGYGQPIPD